MCSSFLVLAKYFVNISYLHVTKGLERVISDLEITSLPTYFPHKDLCSYLFISSNTLDTLYALE